MTKWMLMIALLLWPGIALADQLGPAPSNSGPDTGVGQLLQPNQTNLQSAGQINQAPAGQNLQTAADRDHLQSFLDSRPVRPPASKPLLNLPAWWAAVAVLLLSLL